MKIIIVIAILATAANVVQPLPDRHPKNADHKNKTAKISGGDPARTGQFPYMAALKSSDHNIMCGASIMCQRWVLTAAHCYNTSMTIVGVGNDYLYSQANYEIQYLIPHPFYDANTMLNDIMLVKTSAAMKLIPGRIQPISINTNSYIDNYAIKNMVLSGWGQYSSGPDDGSRMDNLYWIYYDMQSPSTCRWNNSQSGIGLPYDSSVQSCGLAHDRYYPYPGACFGDFGGPLVYAFVQYGVASRLMSTDGTSPTCGYDSPSVFTKVSQYASWIAQTRATY